MFIPSFSPLPLQLSAFLEVIPGWLPPATVATGFFLLTVGMTREYMQGLLGDWESYSSTLVVVSVVSLASATAGAVYVTLIRFDLILLFVLFTFISGRIVQGAITARIIQKLLDFFVFDSGDSGNDKGYLRAAGEYLWSKLRDRLIIMTATIILTTTTAVSILDVYYAGSGETVEAVRRFWIGLFFLTLAGLIFDFRYFAHRVSWLPAFGLVVATAGAFLYSPAGFSSFTTVLAPYLDNPIPDWMRLPLGALGFVFGVIIWAIFYLNRPAQSRGNTESL
jgi:hypothetical protein